MDELKDKPMYFLTVEQFFALQNEVLSLHQNMFEEKMEKIFMKYLSKENVEETKYEYGLKGLAKALNVSKSKAAQLKSSGDIDDAIYQNGRIIRIDVKLAQQIYFNKNEKLLDKKR